MQGKYLDEDNQKHATLDQLINIEEDADKIVEMAAEQFAYLLWEHMLSEKRAKDKGLAESVKD